MTSICIFEDEGYKQLLPLTWLRPAFDLRCGMDTLYEKIRRHYPRSNVYILCREYLAPSVKRAHPGTLTGKVGKDPSVLFINGRLICSADAAKKMPAAGADEIFECDGVVLAARLSKGNLEIVTNSRYTTDINKYLEPVRSTSRTTQVPAKMIRYFFDLVAHGKEEMVSDFNYLTRGGITRGRVHQSVAVYQRGGIFIDDGADVEAFVTLDARPGPIFISKGARILPYSRIEGPCFIGERTAISAHSNIRAGVSAGPDCRLGGEIEETIFQGRSNKSHFGFLGHSFVAEWVNIGAGTTNSNLKNNYGNVRVRVQNAEIDSGKAFVGCCIGDHTKIAIGSLINTGSVIGACSSIYGGRLMPKYIPSFSWGEARQVEVHDVEKAINTAKAAMGRRNVQFEDLDADLFRKVFELTEKERSTSGVVS